MFCHPEYIHFHEVWDRCEEAAARIVPYVKGEEIVWKDEEKLEIDFERSRGERRQIYASIIYERFFDLMRYRAFACSPDGLLMKLSPWAVRPVIFNHFRRFDDKMLLECGVMLFVDTNTGTIDSTGLEKRLSKLEWGRALTLRYEEKEAAILLQLQGWGVCFAADGCPTADDLVKAQKARETEPKEGDTASVGRPRKREEAAEAYWSLYPQGRGNVSWKDVLKELRDQCNVDVSQDTLMRGLDTDFRAK